jgi:hypothetical protein
MTMTTMSITVNQVANQLVAPPKSIRTSLSEFVGLVTQIRCRRPRNDHPPNWRVIISTRVILSPGVFPDARQPDHHSIPIALGPAQFNEFYR